MGRKQAWGMRAIMRYFGIPRNKPRETLLGAVTAIRSWAALEAIGPAYRQCGNYGVVLHRRRSA
jgi:hypothetical protein